MGKMPNGCVAARMSPWPPHDNDNLVESGMTIVYLKMIITESVAIQTELVLESFENRDNSIDAVGGTT